MVDCCFRLFGLLFGWVLGVLLGLELCLVTFGYLLVLVAMLCWRCGWVCGMVYLVFDGSCMYCIV